MLAFYPKSDWNSADWRTGDFVVVRSKSLNSHRVDFKSTINGRIGGHENEAEQFAKRDPDIVKKLNAEAQQLQNILKQVRADLPRYHADAHPTVKAEHLDPRVVIGDPKGIWFIDRSRSKIANRLGMSGSMRVIVDMKLPGYSP